MISFSVVENFNVFLPAATRTNSSYHLVVWIRDQLDAITEWHLSTVIVQSDQSVLLQLWSDLQDASIRRNRNPFVQRLASGNQNSVTQLVSALGQQINEINNARLQNVTESKSFKN
jgi:hypothetical protein